MSASSIAEFQSFRFARDRNGALAEIPLDRRGERQFLVLDCLHYRVARLHIFEGLATDGSEAGGRFQSEMEAIGRLGHPSITPILSFGRDDTELFIADSLVNGEALGRYLRRTGPLSEYHALEVMLDLLDVLTCRPELLRTLANFDTGRLHVTVDPARPNRLRLHFNDFTGWTQSVVPGPAELAARGAVALYSLLAGFVFRFPPFSAFQREASHTSPELQKLLLPMLAEGGPEGGLPDLRSLRDALLAHREGRRAAGMDADVPPLAEPREFLRDWLLEGAGPVDPGSAFRILGPDPASGGYAYDAVFAKGGTAHGKVRFQLFPNWESIPRDGWLEQHQSALRRPGRGMPNQLTVAAVEPWGRCLLIGEERAESVTLDAVIRQIGPMDLPNAREIVLKVNAALEAMEKTAGAAPVWWLTPRNVHLVTGNENAGLLRQAVERHGTAAWQRLPVRLRLHQTARDLVEGLTFPESIMKRVRAGGKAGERGRRAVALLPLLCELLDGVPFSWERPIVASERLPAAAARVLEQTRLKLLEDPKNVQIWLLDDLSRSLVAGEDKGRSSRGASATSLSDGMVSAPASIFDELEGSGPAVAPAREGSLGVGGLSLLGKSTVTMPTDAPSVEIEVTAAKAETIVDESIRAMSDETEGAANTGEPAPTKKRALFGGWFGSPSPSSKLESAKERDVEPEMAEEPAIEDFSKTEPELESITSESGAAASGAAEPVTSEKKASPFLSWIAFRAREPEAAEPEAESQTVSALAETVTVGLPEIQVEDQVESEAEVAPAPEAKPSRREFSFRSPSRGTATAVLIPTSVTETQSTREDPAPPQMLVPGMEVKKGATTFPLLPVAALAALTNPFETVMASPAVEASTTLVGNPFDAPVAPPVVSDATAPEAPPSPEPIPEPIAESPSEPEAEAQPEPEKLETVPLLEAPSHSPEPRPALIPTNYEKGLGEPLSFFAFLNTESQQAAQGSPTPDSPVAAEAPATSATTGYSPATLEAEGIPSAPPMPSPAQPRTHDPIDLPSIGRLFAVSDTASSDLEAVAAVAVNEPTETRRRRFSRFSRGVAILIGFALALWGATYGLVAIAGSVERETLAETFAPVVHTDYLKLAQQAPFPPSAPADDPLPKATGSVASVAKASEAIQQGDDARQDGRFADAVNLYLRAIELEPASGEARTQLSAAMEAWTGAENEPVSTSGDGGGRIDRSADYAPKAAWLLADHYLERDRALGLRWLRKSAESGHPRHQRLLGIILSPVPESQAEALDWLRRAAESGDAESQLLYGASLLRGRGIALDAKLGADWIEKAALAGDPRAMDLFGVCHASGLGRASDSAAALLWFQRACDAGNARARYNLAVRYAKGLGAPADKARAAREFQAGANESDAHAMHGLGRCLEAGFGVARDLKGASNWMRQAAVLGHHEALAWCLRQGIAVEVEVAKY